MPRELFARPCLGMPSPCWGVVPSLGQVSVVDSELSRLVDRTWMRARRRADGCVPQVARDTGSVE